MHPVPLLVNRHLARLLCPIPQPRWTSCLSDSYDPIQHCRSWNDGACRWSLGQCRYRHVCERYDGQHPLTNCTFQAYKGSQRSRSLGENAVGVNNKVALQITAPSCVNIALVVLWLFLVPLCVNWCWFPEEDWTAPNFLFFRWFLLVCIGSVTASAAASFIQSFFYKSGKIKQGNAHTSRSIFNNLCLAWSSEWVSCWFRPCFGLLEIGHTEYALC